MKKEQKNILVNLFLIAAFITIGIIYFFITEDKNISAIIGGISGGVVVALLNIFRNVKMQKNEFYKKQVEIEGADERNIFLNLKAINITCTILLFLGAIFSLICVFLGKRIFLYFFPVILLLFSVIFFISKAILEKKY